MALAPELDGTVELNSAGARWVEGERAHKAELERREIAAQGGEVPRVTSLSRTGTRAKPTPITPCP
mgnify:CR=1 FL=1